MRTDILPPSVTNKVLELVSNLVVHSSIMLCYNISSTKYFNNSRKSVYNVSQCNVYGVHFAQQPYQSCARARARAPPGSSAHAPPGSSAHALSPLFNGMSTAWLAAITLLCGASPYYTVMLRGGGLLEHGNKKTTRDLCLFLLEVTPRSAVLLRRQGMSVTV